MKKFLLTLVALVTIGLLVTIGFVSKEEEQTAAPAHKPTALKPGIKNEKEVVTLDTVTGDDEAITMIEDEMGKLSPDEIKLKPPNMAWGRWAKVVSIYRIDKAMNGSIDFYGRVVSEDDSPLSGVSLNAEITYAEPSLAKLLVERDRMKTQRIPVTTDANGKFQLSKLEGASLVLRDFQKVGYQLAGTRKGWGYSFVPDSTERYQGKPDSPEIFKMKKVE